MPTSSIFSLPKPRNRMTISWVSIAWKIKTKLIKWLISFEDRHHLFSYSRWLSEHEKNWGCPEWKNYSKNIVFDILLLDDVSDHSALNLVEKTLTSIQHQTYPFWNVIIITPQYLSLSETIRSDARIQIIIKSEGISDIQQSLLNIKGDWISFCRAGDLLSPPLLAEVAQQTNESPDSEIYYTDEDLVTSYRPLQFSSPWFKPDWSPELLCSVNYLKHGFFQRKLLSDIRGANTLDDLVFCMVEHTICVHHIPKILIHAVKDSIPLNKPGDEFLGAVKAHFERTGNKSIEVARDEHNHIHLLTRPSNQMVSIIIPTRDNVNLLRACIKSILQFTNQQPYELILIDTGSQNQETFSYYNEIHSNPSIHLYSDHRPFNYSAANNFGAEKSSGDFLLFLNNDIEVLETDWLTDLIVWASQPNIGAVGCRLLYPDSTIQHAGVVVGMEGHAGHLFNGQPESINTIFGSPAWARNTSAVTGACLMIRRNIFQLVGGFDEDFGLVFNDVDLCLRVQQHGYRVVYSPYPRLIHHEGKSRGRYNPPGDIIRATVSMKPWIQKGDPYYNPNCSLAVHFPTLVRNYEENPIKRLNHITRYYNKRSS